MAVITVVGLGIILYLALEPSPPKIPVFPYIMENETESTSSDENPWWPDGWSANSYHGLMDPVYVNVWYKGILEGSEWMPEVDNFDAYQIDENVININTLLVVTKGKWATLVVAIGRHVPELDWGECLIIVGQGPREGLPYLYSHFGDLFPEPF